MAAIVPFPMDRRKQWIAEIVDQGARLDLIEASKLFTRSVLERKVQLRGMGVAEDLVLADTEPVKRLFMAELDQRTARLVNGYTLWLDPEDAPHLQQQQR